MHLAGVGNREKQKLAVPGCRSNGGYYKREKEDPDPLSKLSSEISWL